MFDEKTRLKLALLVMGAIFIQAIIKTFLPAYPFAEAVGFMVGIYGGYAWAKTADNQTTLKVQGICTSSEEKKP